MSALFHRILLIIFLHCFSFGAFCQDSIPDFGAPLDIPLYLSGNFAELRRNHFHTGLDIKTGGVEGVNVLASADGFVSRIAVSPYGYGLALYIDHPNGYTTVYGHLRAFSPAIAEVVRTQQYKEESFKVDFSPSTKIYLKKGEIIAESGNSGGSGGPHLHFEIRKTESEHPQNPLLFNFDIKDNIAPRLRGLRFHALSDTTLINGKNQNQSFVVTGTDGKYKLDTGQKIELSGVFGISIHALDFLNAYPNKCGIYSSQLSVDGAVVCAHAFKELDFSTVRQINCYKDYEVYRENNWHYHKSFIEPGNKLEIYQAQNETAGYLSFEKAGVHQAEYLIKDAYGNESKLSFTFETIVSKITDRPEQTYDAYFAQGQENNFEYKDELAVKLPADALYTHLKFQFGREMPSSNGWSPIYRIHNERVPLDKPIEIRFKKFEKAITNPAQLLAKRTELNGRTAYITGSYAHGEFLIETKDFGTFEILLDTEPPSLSVVTGADKSKLSDGTVLRYKVNDYLSGIESFDAYLNGKWTLMEYDAKRSSLTIHVKEADFKPGANELVINVADGCKNNREAKFTYTY